MEVVAADDVLLGRGTYDYWSDYWPTSDVPPFADFINTTPKHIVTSRPLTGEWDHSVAVETPVAAYVEHLKSQPGGDIGVHGSITLASSLTVEGLVDELQLTIGPVLDPVGRRLFERLGDLRRLQLQDATPTPSGTVWVVYRLP